jgi:hypothetical protein
MVLMAFVLPRSCARRVERVLTGIGAGALAAGHPW